MITILTLAFVDIQKGPADILASMPDPMRPYLYQIIFVMVLVTIMYFYLSLFFFKPLTQMMSDRTAEIQKGSDTKQIAAQQIASEQKKYQEQMKFLRAKAFERKKELTTLAISEKVQLLEQAQREVSLLRGQAQKVLEKASAEARESLKSDIHVIADAMVKRILLKGNQ